MLIRISFYLLSQCILSLFMLVISDVHVLITYSMIVESFFITLSVSAVLYFRYSQPNMVRPIKVRMGPAQTSNL